MATLIQSKQIEGIVTASVIQGDFQASGNISASIISASQIVGVRYGDIEGTPNFVGGSGITITQVGDTYTFTNTGGGRVDDGISDAASILQINAYTASNDLVIQRFEQTTSSLQTQITSLSSSLSNIEVGTTDFSELTGVPTGLVSSSVQILGGSEIVSGSVLRTLDGTNVLSGSKTDISHLNEFTTSIQSQVDELILSASTFITSETDSQTLTIVGDQLTISDGNTITIPTGSSGGVSSWNELTDIPSGLVSGSVLRTLDGTGVLSGSVLTDLSSSIASTIDSIVHTQIPQGTISSSQQISDLGFVTSSGAIGEHTDITLLNQFTSSVQTEIDGLSSLTSSYLTELPSDLISGSVLRTLDGTDVLSGSILPGTGITIDSSSGDYVITSIGSDGDTSFDGNREVTNTLLGDLFSQSYNAGTSGSIQDFLNEMFFPSYAPTATFSTQTSNLNTNLTSDGTIIETISITDTVDDSPYVVTISGDSSDSFRVVPINADSSSWEIQSVDNLTAGTFTYDIVVTDKNGASRTYSGKSVEILQASSGTLSTTGTLYVIESATSGQIYLGSNGRSGAQGGVSVSYSPNYGTQVAQNFTSSNPLISINSSTGVLSVGSPISGSGNVSGDIITSTIGWVDQYGNSSSDTISVNVTQNNAPDISFSNSSRLNTNQAINGGGTLVTISFSDTEGDSINHDSFQFTDTSGQLTATRSGNNYLVTANSNLSGSTAYTIGTTIEDVHGFRSNTESHSFTITESSNGELNGDITIYVIESAFSNYVFRDATGFGAGNVAQVGVTYSPSAGGQSVQSFSSSNPAILINSSGNMTLGVDLSGSTTQSGDTIETLITFQDQYGNIGSGSVTANVFGNLAPSVSFVATSNYNTDNALANSNAGVITISDTETNSPYNVTLSGTNSDSFNVVPQNAASSSWQVQPKNSLSLGTYSIDINVTDNYGETSTLTNETITVSSATDYGSIYVYTNSLGPAGAWVTAQYNAIYGIDTENGDTPPEVTSFTTLTSLLSTFVNNDVIGDGSIVFADGNGILTLRDTISGDATLDSALASNGSISFSGTANILLMYPSGSDMVVPTSIQETINGVSGGGVPYLNADGGGWGIAGAKLNSITLDTPHLGYSEWFVLGRYGTDGVGSSFEYRIVNSDGGSAPS